MDGFFASVLGFLTSVIALVVPGYGDAEAQRWNGYVEADYVYAAALSPGQIATLAVHEGDIVRVGDVLFSLNQSQQMAMLDSAKAGVAVAEANLANLTTGGRQDEIDVIRASLSKAQSDLSLARDTSARQGKLFAQGVSTQSQLDQARATLASAEAAVRQLQAQLKVAELPARDAQQLAAEANFKVAKAAVEKARADLDRLTDREREVATAIGQGMTNADIARTCYMSLATVKAHVTNIFEKLGANNRVQVAVRVHDAQLD